MQLKKYIFHYERNKILIIKKWLSNEDVLEILNNCNLDKELFLRRYAFGVLDYYINIIKDSNKIGTSAVILDFLNYLKKQKVNPSQLYIIFSSFKRAFSDYLFDLDIESFVLINEIDIYFEKSFSLILDRYTKTINDVEEALHKSIDIVDKNVIMSRTDAKGTITKVSSAFCNITQYSNNELVGTSHNILRHPSMSKEIFEDLWKTIKSGKDWYGEIKNLKKNGEFYWVKTTVHPNFDNMGRIISYDAIGEDITSKKKFEQQQNLLVEQSKSAAMGEMISMIAHQWRQPLQAVSILSQKLPITKMLEGEISDELLEKVVNDISSQLDYMSKTIDDFRDYFKPNKRKEEILANTLVEKAVEFLGYMFKVDDIKVEVDNKAHGLVYIHINEIIQVLINIIKNSRDALIEQNIEDRIIYINTSSNESSVCISIEDNAGGIPSEIIGKVFEPYFSTKSNKNGTGLGLYMSKNIVEQHSNGKISASNTKTGAKFEIELPLE